VPLRVRTLNMERLMEKRDEELIDRLMPENEELQKLVKKHKEFEAQLEEFNRRLYLSEEQNREKKRIQKLKLAGRDRIEQILRDYRKSG
jgi:hypothetical protein